MDTNGELFFNRSVGVLTFHYSNHNYGAVLQTYASIVNLRKLGFIPTVVDLRPVDYRTKISIISRFYRIINPNPFEVFRKKFIPRTPMIKCENDLDFLNSQFAVFYVGSDQVWRPQFSKENLKHYFLDFVAVDKIKVAYAVSFGLESIDFENDLKSELSSLIDSFTEVSVREESAVQICKNNFKKDVIHVLDPTLLLEKSDLKSLSDGCKLQYRVNFIALYMLSKGDVNRLDLLSEISGQLKIGIRNIYYKEVSFFGLKRKVFCSIADWISQIENSELVITDSYHCVIFSILFRKQFVCIENDHGGNTRLESLLNQLGLKDRIYNLGDFKCLDLIDYDIVYERLSRLKIKSFDFLKKAINQNPK